ncbi:MAG: epoxyqueuosine reductase [Akkermansiaceae bacterium]|jgi:epoxyqueuosine reductase
MTPAIAKANVSFVARQLGFDDCRISAAARAPHADEYLEWVKEGHAGDMGWLERNTDRRCDPREVLPDCRSVVSLALNYFPAKEQARSDYRIARYAWNDDYHDLIEDKLKDLDLAMQDMGGLQRYYVDTGPILERDFASASGLGWNGKSTVQIHRKLGTWFFLAELLTTLEMEPDSPSADHCGKCTACITACPTQAITAPRKLAATRCISYLTIEHKGAIPLEFRRAIGDRIYGCDDCLDACPWNRFAQTSREASFHAREEIFDHSLRDFLEMSVKDFRDTFAKSPIKRIKHDRFIRNVCVALGNTGIADDLPKLRELASHESPLIAEHAQWAIAEISERITISQPQKGGPT